MEFPPPKKTNNFHPNRAISSSFRSCDASAADLGVVNWTQENTALGIEHS